MEKIIKELSRLSDRVLPLGEDGEEWIISKKDASTEDEALLLMIGWLYSAETDMKYAIEMVHDLEAFLQERTTKLVNDEEWYYLTKEGEKGEEYWTIQLK